MAFPERFSNLPDYAFPRLRALLDTHAPGGEPIAMTIGEPKHPQPPFVGEVIAANLDGFGVYPPNDGTPELLAANAAWLTRRYGVEIGPERIMGLNGTREGLFNAAIALCPESKNGKQPVVLMPNPFYQVYAVAALAVGAEPCLRSGNCSQRVPAGFRCARPRAAGPHGHCLPLFARQSAGGGRLARLLGGAAGAGRAA